MTRYKQPSAASQDQYKPVINEWAIKAQQHYHTNNLESARYWAKKATELDQGNVAAWNVLGRIALDQNSLSQSERLFKQALAVAPRNEETLINLGYSYLAQGNYDSAERCFLRALNQNSSGEKARISLAYTAMLQGQIEIAFSSYRKLFREGVDHPHVIDALINCAEQFVADRFLPELAQDITDLFAYEDIDHQRLAPLAISLLSHRYQLDDSNAEISFDSIYQDSLLISTLQRCTLSSPLIESFLKSVREALLRVCIETEALNDEWIPLVIAMGIHQSYAGYIASYTADEELLLLNVENAIADQIKQASCSPDDIVGAVLITAMYKDLYSLEYSYGLAKYDLEEWPIGAQAILDLAFYQPQQHAIFQHTVNEHFSDSRSDVLPLATPYWESLSKQQQVPFEKSFYSQLLTESKTRPELLVLSCDAGQKAMHIAKAFPDLEIVVIEPNRSNVAYGLMQSANLDITNIEFRCGDLEDTLEEQKFSLIECSDWLDYVEDSDQFITQLLSHLHDDGIIKLSLDSSIAGEGIREIQDFIRCRNLTPGDTDLRILRDSILADNKWHELINAPWFYQSSSVANKLFHQRHFYSMNDVIKICEKHQLAFLEFSHLDPKKIEQYQSLNTPTNAKQDLLQWLHIEQDHPSIFSNGYQMVCEKTSDSSHGDIILITHASH